MEVKRHTREFVSPSLFFRRFSRLAKKVGLAALRQRPKMGSTSTVQRATCTLQVFHASWWYESQIGPHSAKIMNEAGLDSQMLKPYAEELMMDP
jgi:hypothetical protein